MEPEALIRSMGVARVVLGLGLAVVPRLVTTPWLGIEGMTPAAKVLARSMGARDAAIGAGLLAAAERGGSTRAWLTAGIAADATDLAATVAQRDQLPRVSVPLIAVAAGAGVAMGAYALAAADS